jgi:hypothetical protein
MIFSHKINLVWQKLRPHTETARFSRSSVLVNHPTLLQFNPHTLLHSISAQNRILEKGKYFIVLQINPYTSSCSLTNQSLQSSYSVAVQCLHIFSYRGRLELHSNMQSHWSRGSTVCFPRPGDAPTLTMGPGSPISDVSLRL